MHHGIPPTNENTLFGTVFRRYQRTIKRQWNYTQDTVFPVYTDP